MDGSVRIADLAAALILGESTVAELLRGDPSLFEVTLPSIRPACLRAAGRAAAPGMSQELVRRPMTAGPPLAATMPRRGDRAGRRGQAPAGAGRERRREGR